MHDEVARSISSLGELELDLTPVVPSLQHMGSAWLAQPGDGLLSRETGSTVWADLTHRDFLLLILLTNETLSVEERVSEEIQPSSRGSCSNSF